MMPDFDNPMDRGAMELDADRIMKTKATGNSLEKKESKHARDTSNKSFTMPLKQMSAGCSICGKMSQNGVGGICKGCWNQFQEKGVRIGNISEFEQFTEAVKKQVSRIIYVGSDDKSSGGQEKLIENIRQIVPEIFTNKELEQTASKRALFLDNDQKQKSQISPTKPGMTRSKTFAYLKQDEGAKNKDASKVGTSPTKISKIKRATTGITVKSSMTDKSLSSRKSTTAVLDKKTSHRDNAPSTSSSTASQKEVYTPITIDKSKYLAVSLEQIEQRNRQMQINKPRSSKMRSKGHSHRKKSSKNDPTPIGGMMYGRGNALKRMAYDKKKHHSGSEDDDEDDDLDNVPSYASQDKLNMARPSSSSNSRSEYTSKSFDQFDYGSRQAEHKPIQYEKYNVEKYGLYTENDKEREQQPREVLSSPGMTREPDQPGSPYYQKPGISTAISNLISKSDYFMPSIPEAPPAQDDAYWGESPVKAANSVAMMEHAESQKTPENYYADTKPKTLESNDYTSYKMGNINNAVTNSSIYAVDGGGNTTKKRDFAFGGGENMATSKGIEHKEDLSGNLYTIAKQFPVAALQVQEAYFEPFSGRNTPNPMLQMAAIGGVNLVKGEAKIEKTEDYYTGGFGPTTPTSAVVTSNQYTGGDLVKKEDYFTPKGNSIYAADGYSLSKQTSYTSHTSNENSYYGSDTNVKPLTSSLYTELKPANTDSDCYTGALFHAPQLITGVGFKKENRMGIDDRVVHSAIDQSEIINPSNSLGPSLSSGHSDTPTQETRKSSRMFRKQQRFNSIDSLFENSVSSAGEFFSKAIATSFGNNNGNSNYCYSASEAICGTNAYNEDQMDFGELGRKKSNDYVDWDPRLKPKYGVMNEKPRRPVRTLDFSKYKLYDFVGNDSGSTDLSSKSQESPWYNSHDEGSYGGQRNTTWDGRAWPIEKPSQPRPRRSESTDAYTDMPDCRICPNNNNSSASMSCFGNMNNNYPNYEIYETQSDNTPRRDPQLQRPVSSDNDYAPYMYGNPSQERQRPRQETPRRVTQTQGGYMDAGGSPYFGLNTCSSSMADYADYADSPPPEQLRVVREPSPPRPPKVIKVGSILVRNNVENNDDYAENVNRDLGEDSSSFGGMAFNQEMNHQGKAFAYQTSQSLVSEPANLRQIMDVQNALERERSVPKPQSKPLRRERSLQRDSLKPTVHNNDNSKKSYSNNKYDDGEDRKSWAQERKSLTDVRKTSQESRKTTRDVQKSYKPNNKPKRSASMGGRESTYVQHRPSAGGDHMRSAKPHQTREERSYRKERPQNVYSKKDDKKKEEEKKGRSYGSWLNPLNLFRGK